MSPEHQEPEGPPDSRPYLCIPYWTKALKPGGHWDTGAQRPLPKSVVEYMCESIKASPYTPGQDLHVSVAVRNSGGGNSASLATVVVYWSDPTAGFAKLNFLGVTSVAVMPDRDAPTTALTPTMTAKIPADAPDHICLLAIVSHPQDKAGVAFNPVEDRHWAQRNLVSVAVVHGTPALVPFKLANPFPYEAELALRIAPADRRRGEVVASALGLENADAQPILGLLTADGSPIGETGDVVNQRFGLDGRGELGLQVTIDLSTRLPVGTAGTVEALVLDTDPEHDGQIVGSLGITLLPS